MYRNVSGKRSVSSSYVRNAMIMIPNTVNITIENRCIFVIGVLGKLIHTLHASIIAKIDDVENILVVCYTKREVLMGKSLVGTTKSLICGMIAGVTHGFVKKLQLIGIGYRASITNNVINLIIGFSHPISYKLPKEIKATCVNQTEIILEGIDKQLVGQIASNLRAIRPPEPFKGKGIRYMDEIVRNKDTKKR